MQTLYSIDSMSGDLKPGETVTILTKRSSKTASCLPTWFILSPEVARYAKPDTRIRASEAPAHGRRPQHQHQDRG